MKKIGVGVDYSNICKDYNTFYLDRDNKDPATSKCMKQVLAWTEKFISDLLKTFDYKVFNLSTSSAVKVGDIASKRFLFYSLEKEITLQSYVLQKEYVAYESLTAWELETNETVLIQNDEDGGSLYFFVNEGSAIHPWILDTLKDFSLDEVEFQAIK